LTSLLAVIVFGVWGNLWPFLTAGLAFVFLAGCVALGVLLIGWSVFRVRAVREDTALEVVSTVFAKTAVAQPTPSTPDTAHSWKIAYLQIAFLGYSKQSFSFRTLAPYFENNARAYWDHMKRQLMTAGWVAEKGRRVRTVFNGSCRRFSAGVRLGHIVLLPHPLLPPPNVRWVSRGFNTPGTAATPATLDTLENLP
jgi:hypothetical protein